MRAYLTYKSTGNVFGWYELNEEKQDEVDLVLPDGASEVETAAGGRAIELADGQICPDILTVHHDGICQPYIVDCSGSTPRNIYLKVSK